MKTIFTQWRIHTFQCVLKKAQPIVTLSIIVKAAGSARQQDLILSFVQLYCHMKKYSSMLQVYKHASSVNNVIFC